MWQTGIFSATAAAWCILQVINGVQATTKQKNIVFIVSDDMGINDVSYQGSNQIPTPNIDSLAHTGCVLTRYYNAPVCTPSRSQIMTGKYAHHLGMQDDVIYEAQPYCLSPDEKLLSQYMLDLGYDTNLVGKWHLGHYRSECLPLCRGFNSHLGYWTGHVDAVDHTAFSPTPAVALDFRRGFEVADDLSGQYYTDIFTNEAERIIENHNFSKPLFLMMAYGAPHAGNPEEPLKAPQEDIAYCANDLSQETPERQIYCAIMVNLDRNIGRLIVKLNETGVLHNTLIVFNSDNGGAPRGSDQNAASNYPLRGGKYTFWEGGVRLSGVIWDPELTKKGKVCNQMMHGTDWLPTLYEAAGGNPKDLPAIDGVSLWSALKNDQPSPRDKTVHIISGNFSAMTKGDYKIVTGTTAPAAPWSGWYGPSGRKTTRKYGAENILQSPAYKALSSVTKTRLTPWDIILLRSEVEIKCPVLPEDRVAPVDCNPTVSPCLYNIRYDPCENKNLALRQPFILAELLADLEEERKTEVPSRKKPADARGNPIYNNCTWSNFGDLPGAPYCNRLESEAPQPTANPPVGLICYEDTYNKIIQAIKKLLGDDTTIIPQ